jgi:hypothetical protein
MNKYIQEINPTEYFIKSKLLMTNNEKDRILRGLLYDIYNIEYPAHVQLLKLS